MGIEKGLREIKTAQELKEVVGTVLPGKEEGGEGACGRSYRGHGLEGIPVVARQMDHVMGTMKEGTAVTGKEW